MDFNLWSFLLPSETIPAAFLLYRMYRFYMKVSDSFHGVLRVKKGEKMKKKLRMYTDNSIINMEASYETENPVAVGTDGNYSSILTKLIQDTGRFCLHYASDLFILWDTAITFLGQVCVWGGAPEEIGFAFGIREDGVDDAGTVARNLAKGPRYYYRAVYVLETTRKNGTVYMSLYKADSLKTGGTKDENTERKLVHEETGWVGIDEDYPVSIKQVLDILAETGAIVSQERIRNELEPHRGQFDPVLTSLEELIQEYGEDGSFTIKGRGDISAAELLEELKKGSETGNIFRTMVTKTIVEYFMKFGS